MLHPSQLLVGTWLGEALEPHWSRTLWPSQLSHPPHHRGLHSGQAGGTEGTHYSSQPMVPFHFMETLGGSLFLALLHMEG